MTPVIFFDNVPLGFPLVEHRQRVFGFGAISAHDFRALVRVTQRWHELIFSSARDAREDSLHRVRIQRCW